MTKKSRWFANCPIPPFLRHPGLRRGTANLNPRPASCAATWPGAAPRCRKGAATAARHRPFATKAWRQLALATLGPATFGELRDAFRGVDDYRHTLNFLAADEVGRLAHAAGFATVDLQTRRETAFYPDLATLLRAVKAVGANQLGAGRRSGLMSRAAFARVEAAWETRRTAQGLPLTYDVIYLHAQP